MQTAFSLKIFLLRENKGKKEDKRRKRGERRGRGEEGRREEKGMRRMDEEGQKGEEEEEVISHLSTRKVSLSLDLLWFWKVTFLVKE